MDILFLLFFWSLFALKVASELAPVIIAVVAVKAFNIYKARTVGPTLPKPSRVSKAFKAAMAELFRKV